MAATWPSIIPLGATMSAPAVGLGHAPTRRTARGWRRCRPRRRRSSTPQCPWSVYSSRHRSAMSTTLVADVVAQVAQRDLHDAVGIPRPRALGVLGGRHAEEDHGRARRAPASSCDLLAQRLARVLHDAGQRRDRLRLVDALAHEQRRDQVVDPETGLGDQPAQGRRAAQPPQPALRARSSPRSVEAAPAAASADGLVLGLVRLEVGPALVAGCALDEGLVVDHVAADPAPLGRPTPAAAAAR